MTKSSPDVIHTPQTSPEPDGWAPLAMLCTVGKMLESYEWYRTKNWW